MIIKEGARLSRSLQIQNIQFRQRMIWIMSRFWKLKIMKNMHKLSHFKYFRVSDWMTTSTMSDELVPMDIGRRWMQDLGYLNLRHRLHSS